MALYTMTDQEIKSLPTTTFQMLGITERADLQRLLRRNIDVIGEEIEEKLLVISEEFSNWENAKRRIDLLAIDKEANLVVIELKRDEDGSHMELQAIRYAGMVARMTFEQAAEAFSDFLKSINDQRDSRASILEFLEWSEPNAEAFGQDVRIVLVSANFSQEITTTVLWLNERDLDIRCLRLKPYQLDGKIILNVEQIIPLPESDKYQTQIRMKKQADRAVSRTQRSERVLDVLVARGILKPGARLHLVHPPRLGLNITDEKAKHATFEDTGRQGIRWDFDGLPYTLNGLCIKLCEMGGVSIGAGSFRGPNHWGLDGQTVSLTDLHDGLPDTQETGQSGPSPKLTGPG